MDQSLTNVLIFKDGYYYLTIHRVIPASYGPLGGYPERIDEDSYQIADGLDHNGFEFASDAYAYLVSLQAAIPAKRITLDTYEYNDREEERLSESGEV